MKKLSKKQIVALYILTAVIFVCLIGAILILRRDSVEQQQASSAKTSNTTESSDTQSEDTAETVEEVTAADMINELTPMLGLPSTVPLDADKIAYYYDLEEEAMAECAGVIGELTLADELVIIKAKDEQSVPIVEKGANNRLESQKSSFQDYIPEQFKRLEKAQIVTSGQYVMFVCSDDSDAIVDKFKSMAK